MSPRRWPVARQLLVLQAVSVLVVTALVAFGVVVYTAHRESAATAGRVRGIAVSIAANPFVVSAVGRPDPSVDLEPYAERIQRRAGVDFVVIMAPNRVRYTHPDPSEIGKPFRGDIGRALAGHTFTETYTGTLGPSVRAVSPVFGTHGQVVALVAVGVTTRAIRAELLGQLPFLGGGLALLLAVALAGAVLVSRRLRHQTRGLDPVAIAQMYASTEAVLHSLREGLLVIDADGRIGMINDEAQRLLGVDEHVVGRSVADLDLPDSLVETLVGGQLVVDELHLTGERLLILNQSPTQWRRRAYGTVVTLRDRTELEALTGELDTTKAFAEALRSQAHEAANRLHTMVVLVETGRAADAVAFATSELAVSQRLTDVVVAAVEEPVLVALLLGKSAQAAERGAELIVTDDSRLPAGLLPGPELVTVVGNLVDNALDACAEADGTRRVTVTIRVEDGDVLVQVADTGPGLPAHLLDVALTRGYSTKAAASAAGRGLGLALVNTIVTRHRGAIEVVTPSGGGSVFVVRIPSAAVLAGKPADVVRTESAP